MTDSYHTLFELHSISLVKMVDIDGKHGKQ